MNAADDFIVRGDNLTKRFERPKLDPVTALNRVSFGARPGALIALVGPDGAGKTTLLRLTAGLMRADEGTLTVLGLDAAKQPQAIQDRISYMPQRFGLYEDLSVQENLDLYADLHGVGPEQRAERYPRLMEMTALAPFLDRLAGKLSGGMKQKLGLACTLVRSPELLLLDEPTVGVDPLSRRELWDIVSGLVENEGLSVIVSTSYMDEAERCAHVVVLHEGNVLANGTPKELMSRATGHSFLAMSQRETPARKLQADLIDRPDVIDAVPHGGQVRVVLGDREPLSLQDVTFEPTPPILEDSLMMLLRHKTDEQPAANAALELSKKASQDHSEVVIEVHDLVRKFGDFTAVNRTSFEVKRGEVFGLLGPNGAGKTTTFRMLCGLLPATSGTLKVAGADLRRARAEARQNIGYVAQKFSLYGDISVLENLQFFAGAYGLRNSRAAQRIEWALDNFELKERVTSTAGSLPGGFQRRLAMAAALLHEPAIVFLDEPTSGADPLARREFWRRIGSLADHGTTIVVTTHFMEEAEYCDRIMIQDAGTMLAIGTPEEVRRQAGSGGEPAHSMEDAFIGIVEQARERAQRQDHAA
ncbi:ATP-binding cassette domain-containing protein [Peristeroidobacter agariperforans]|uniref:ATP-binding cassette domain-containing protein n=1 Tax=Peristeroidobacter agariperforans TaxID=268404 RepID=UPI00101C87A1|nr:ATP-binding cassette domain-containing protein [Peristeroidobacter agariperforans]